MTLRTRPEVAVASRTAVQPTAVVEVTGNDPRQPVITIASIRPEYAHVVLEVQFHTHHRQADPMGVWDAYQCLPATIDADAATASTTPINPVIVPDHRALRGHARAVIVTPQLTWISPVTDWEIPAL